MAYPLTLKGKTALITGASRGIGAAIAEVFAQAGANLVLTALQDDDLAAYAEKLSTDFNVRCLSYCGDVSDHSSLQNLYSLVKGQFGQLDVLVANAGILADGLIGMISAADIAKTLDTNVVGVLNHVQLASRLMRQKKSGSIIVMSSIVGRYGHDGQTLYASSKAALLGMMMSAAKELGRDGIRVNAVAPGYIETDMTKGLKPEKRDRLLKSVALARSGQPRDVAEVVLFLASDLARYVSGQVVGVDGAMVI